MIARILVWAALLAGAAATAAGMLAPLHPPADFLNHFRPYILAAGCIPLVAALALRMRRTAWTAAALVGLNAALLLLPLRWLAEPSERPAAGQALASVHARELKLVTFNMAYGDAKAVAAFLLREDPDIAVLQEVGARQLLALRALLRALELHPRPSLGKAAYRHLQIAQDHGQEVVEVVGNAAGQLPDRLDPLRLPQVLLQRFPPLGLGIECRGTS